MTRFEERLRDALLEATLPGFAARDRAGFFTALDAAAPPILQLGLRAAVWVLGVFGPLILLGRPRTVAALSAGDRERLVARAAAHRSYYVRQLAVTLKLVACFGWFHLPGPP